MDNSQQNVHPNYQQTIRQGNAPISNGVPVDTNTNVRLHNQRQQSGVPHPQAPNQGDAPQGQRPQQRPQQGQRPPQRPQQGQRPIQGQRPLQPGQRPMQGQNMQYRQGNIPQQNMQGQQTGLNGVNLDINQGMPQQNIHQQQKKKKFPIVLIIIIALVLIIGGVVGYKLFTAKQNANIAPTADQGIIEVVNQLNTALSTYDANALDTLIGVEEGDSYLAQEMAYVNNVSWRVKFLQMVGQSTQLSVSQDGLNTVSITYPDYDAITEMMTTEKADIEKLYKASNYKETDYDYSNELTNLMLQYITDKGTLPTKTEPISLDIRMSTAQAFYIGDDTALDDLLFGSDSFHSMGTKFSQICTGWTGKKLEKYMTKEEQHNPEYDEWYAVFIKYYEADNGKYSKNSKWEPWYLRDDNNEIQYDENGEKIVNYYSVKAEDGTDWIQPAETISVDVEKEREVDDPWVDERGITYTWCGTHFITTYEGKSDTSFRIGDGSFDYPAGIGTSIITKIQDVDGKYHDVRVTLLGYWVGQNAIDYVEAFDTRNRGLITESAKQLITFEVLVENLEDTTWTASSEMALVDRNSNLSSKTGVIYGLTEEFTLEPHKSTIINDWYNSTEIDQKYAIWGSSFRRQYPMVCFNILAGSGYIPEYSAYEYFTGKSSIDSDVNIQNNYDESNTGTATPSTDTTTQDTSMATPDTTEVETQTE